MAFFHALTLCIYHVRHTKTKGLDMSKGIDQEVSSHRYNNRPEPKSRWQGGGRWGEAFSKRANETLYPKCQHSGVGQKCSEPKIDELHLQGQGLQEQEGKAEILTNGSGAKGTAFLRWHLGTLIAAHQDSSGCSLPRRGAPASTWVSKPACSCWEEVGIHSLWLQLTISSGDCNGLSALLSGYMSTLQVANFLD